MHSINKPEERFNGRVTETIYNVSLTESELMILKEAILSNYKQTVASVSDLKSEVLKDSEWRLKYMLLDEEKHLSNLYNLRININHILETELK
jgi:hypothetical protein